MAARSRRGSTELSLSITRWEASQDRVAMAHRQTRICIRRTIRSCVHQWLDELVCGLKPIAPVISRPTWWPPRRNSAFVSQRWVYTLRPSERNTDEDALDCFDVLYCPGRDSCVGARR